MNKKIVSILGAALAVLIFLPCVSADTISGVDIYRGDSDRGQINWTQLSQTQRFVYIKSDEGEHTADPMFYANVTGAESVNIPWGPYHFMRFYGPASAKRQAEYFWIRIKEKHYSLVPALDCESYDDERTSAGIRADISAFMTEFKKLSGYKPILYASTSYVNDNALDFDTGLWQADYRGYAGSVPAFGAWAAWQYSERGTVQGIANHEVDLDYGKDGIFLSGKTQSGGSAQKAPGVTQASPDVYPVKSLPGPVNSRAGADFDVLDSNGNHIGSHEVYKNDRICILGVDYFRQLAKVIYPVSGGYMHGYIHNREDLLHNSGYDKWHNGSTNEPVYDASGVRVGTIYLHEKATVLDRTGSMTHILYGTAKGAETKSGYVRFGGLK